MAQSPLTHATLDLPTPSLVLDGPTVRRNLRRMADYVAARGIGLRPHTKTHKSLFIAQLQRDEGRAAGLTVAKVGEAEIMARACDDLLMAYPAVDARRCQRLAVLARDSSVRVGIDSTTAADALATAAAAAGSTIGILVDLDVGLHRTGVPDAAAALQLAQHVHETKGLRLDGLMFYPGHVTRQPDEQASAMRAVDAMVNEALDLWRRHGLPAAIVSGGSTPTAYHSHMITRQTEIRPGTYVFNDMNCVRGGFATLEDCAARIICTVVSTAVRGQVVLDAGSKTLTSDRCGPAPDSGHGHIVEYPAAKITKLTEEHGQVDISNCDRAPSLGERVSVIPNHICPCVNLQDVVWWLEEGAAPRPLKVDARGKVF